MELDSILNDSNISDNVKNYLREHMPNETVLKEIAEAFNKSVLFDVHEKCKQEEKEKSAIEDRIKRRLLKTYKDFFEDDMIELQSQWKVKCGRDHVTIIDWIYSMDIWFSAKISPEPNCYAKISKLVYNFRPQPDCVRIEEKIKLLKKFDDLLEEAWYSIP